MILNSSSVRDVPVSETWLLLIIFTFPVIFICFQIRWRQVKEIIFNVFTVAFCLSWLILSMVTSHHNVPSLEAQITDICFLLCTHTYLLVVIWTVMLIIFSLLLLVFFCGRCVVCVIMCNNHIMFSRRRWSGSLSPTSRTTGWSSTRDCWIPNPCHCACRYTTLTTVQYSIVQTEEDTKKLLKANSADV